MTHKKTLSLFPLNPAQRKAVETIEGPVMVIAGPGTGKTQTLTARIAYILEKTDTPPDGILALTFTDAAAREMRERLVAAIGAPAYYVNIQTFHAFAGEVIRTNPDIFPKLSTLEPLSDLERVRLFRDIIDRGAFDALKPRGAPYFYIPALSSAISDLKREGVSPEQLKKLLGKHKPSNPKEEKYAERNTELVSAHLLYQQFLRERGRYDFEDMITLVTDAFATHAELLLASQERFLYFLVDEYQDTNSAQNALLLQLTSYWGRDANLFVVADDDQAIFRFQGASIENILSYHDLFPNAVIVTLTENYRSTQTILDAARGVIAHNTLTLTKKIPSVSKNLVAQGKTKGKRINVVRSSSGPTEVFFVAKKIQELIAGDTPPAEIAVLYRNNADGADMAEMLSRMDIPYDLEGGKNILTDPLIDRLLLLMRAVGGVRNNQEGVDLFTLLNYSFIGADYVDVLKLARFAADRKISLWGAMTHKDLSTLTLAKPHVLSQIYDLLGKLQTADAEGPFVLFFERLINDTGFLNWCLRAPDAVEKLNILNSFFAEIKRLNNMDHELNLASFLELIDLMRDQRVAVTEQDLNIRGNSVALLTAHRAKGREFSTVFIIKAVDRKWGNNAFPELIKLPTGILKKTDVEKKERNEDERRLFYVALTRAKQEVYLSSAITGGPAGRRETVETMFRHEIPEQLIEKVDVSEFESGVKEILENLLRPVSAATHATIDEEAFLRQVLTNFKLSPTALNTYLMCPYKFKLNNLLRAPRAKSPVLSYGTAIHRALEVFFREFQKTRKLPDEKLLHEILTDALKQEILTEVQSQHLTERGKHTLSQYLDWYRDELTMPVAVEKFFGYGYSKTFLGSIPLGGKIDKIESIDGDLKRVRVVDYKTGQPKSRNEIEGKTVTSSGDYKRQLVFYHLLARLDERFQATVEEAELDFVEAERGTGKFKKERFTITEEEVEELKNVIRRAWTDILALKFLRTTDTQKHCPGCEWRYHCWPDGIPSKDEQLSLLP